MSKRVDEIEIRKVNSFFFISDNAIRVLNKILLFIPSHKKFLKSQINFQKISFENFPKADLVEILKKCISQKIFKIILAFETERTPWMNFWEILFSIFNHKFYHYENANFLLTIINKGNNKVLLKSIFIYSQELRIPWAFYHQSS